MYFVVSAPNIWFRHRTRKRLNADHHLLGNDRVFDGLCSVSRSLRSGQSLALSLTIASQSEPSDLLVKLNKMINSGSAVHVACYELLKDISLADRATAQTSDLIMTLHVLALASEVGGNTAEHIDALVGTLLERSHERQDRQAQASMAMASTRLITWLPVVCGAWIIADSSSIRHLIFFTPLGWACLVIGIALNICGRLWTRNLVRR